MKKKPFILIALVVLLMFSLMLLPRPVPHVSEEACLVIEGRVVAVEAGGAQDVVLSLAGNNQTFYINRGLETGLELATLQKQLLHQRVEIKYPPYWTPLDPFGSISHISKLTLAGEVIFSELE